MLLPEIVRDVWLGLTAAHRLFFQVVTVLGCMAFLVLGACMR